MTALLVIERDKLPVVLNAAKRSKGIWLIQKELAEWRKWATAFAADMEPLAYPLDVTVEHLRKNRGSMPDTGAPILAVKAVIDGLVEAGLLPDDGPDVVRRLIFEPPVIVGYQGLRLTLTPALVPAALV